MKKIVVQFLNADGSEFRDKIDLTYDASGTAEESYEEFWAIDEAIAQLSLFQYEFPSGPG